MSQAGVLGPAAVISFGELAILTIRFSSFGEQVKRDISKDKRRTRGIRRKILHTTKEPMFPKGYMTGDTETSGSRIITMIPFMFNVLTKKIT
jgi:hypothetical protein